MGSRDTKKASRRLCQSALFTIFRSSDSSATRTSVPRRERENAFGTRHTRAFPSNYVRTMRRKRRMRTMTEINRRATRSSVTFRRCVGRPLSRYTLRNRIKRASRRNSAHRKSRSFCSSPPSRSSSRVGLCVAKGVSRFSRYRTPLSLSLFLRCIMCLWKETNRKRYRFSFLIRRFTSLCSFRCFANARKMNFLLSRENKS